MGFDQYHEPPEELSAETRSRARMFASLTEEAEAISWYDQRISLEPDADARAIMDDARIEEYKHFAMDLEYLLRLTPRWRQIAEGVLFKDGDIVENGGIAEHATDDDDEDEGDTASAADRTSLGIGSLKGGGLP